MNGFPQDRHNFTRSSGYVEQSDLHSPQTTVAEALWFSSRLRLPPSVSRAAVLAFTQRVRLPPGPPLFHMTHSRRS